MEVGATIELLKISLPTSLLAPRVHIFRPMFLWNPSGAREVGSTLRAFDSNEMLGACPHDWRLEMACATTHGGESAFSLPDLGSLEESVHYEGLGRPIRGPHPRLMSQTHTLCDKTCQARVSPLKRATFSGKQGGANLSPKHFGCCSACSHTSCAAMMECESSK